VIVEWISVGNRLLFSLPSILPSIAGVGGLSAFRPVIDFQREKPVAGGALRAFATGPRRALRFFVAP
jgi:hypothetical protein